MRSLSVLSLLLPAVLVGCDGSAPTVAGPDVALPASRPATADIVPFKTSRYSFQVIGAAVATGCNATGEVRLSLAGEGIATHLGRFTVAFSFCSRPDLTLADGRGTFTAANSDLLDFTFDGTSIVVSPSSVNFTSFVTFTGGTGRFENARGQAIVRGTVNPITGAGSGRWDGTISSVGSSRR
jgi:hypothetical protein